MTLLPVLQKVKKHLFEKRIKINRIELDLISIFFILFGLSLGLYLTIKNVIPHVFANQNGQVLVDTSTDFNYGTLSSTATSGSGSSAVLQMSVSLGPGSTKYKKSVTINTVSSALTDYQIHFSFDTATEITAGRMKSDCGDIRVNDHDDTSSLYYWVENCNSASTKIWVKVPSIPASSSQSTYVIYMYYGNSALTSQSSTTNTFVREITNVVGAWNLDEGSGTSLADKSGNSITGTLNSSSAWTSSGKFGASLSLNGTGNYADLGSPNAFVYGTSARTLCLWAKLSSYTGNTYGWAFAYGNEGGNQAFFIGRGGSNGNDLYIGGYSNDIVAPSYWDTTTWHYVCNVLNGSGSAYVYSNGSLLGGITNPQSKAWNTVQHQAYIGKQVNPGAEYWGGQVDEPRVYSKALSAAEISDLYNNYGYVTTNYTGKELVRKYNSSDPSVSVTTYTTSGTYTSPTNSNTLDTVWNGGWRDGTDTGHTGAFLAKVGSVSSTVNISFQMRIASTTGGLSSATYQTLGTATSGTWLTVSAATLDSLFGTSGTTTPPGTNHYIQVKATFNTDDLSTSATLDKFEINFTADDSPPSDDIGSIRMFKGSGGAEVSSNNWINTDPYFSWTAGSDTPSGIKGYCLYIGTSSTADPANPPIGAGANLLGTTETSTTGSTCNFIISSNAINTATYHGSTWLTTSTGLYYLIIKSIDKANNTAATATSFPFYFDNTIPTPPSDVTLPNTFVNNKTQTMFWSTSGSTAASDGSGSGILGYQYRVGSGPWYGANHNGAQDATDLLDPSTGRYTFGAPDASYIVNDPGETKVEFRVWDVAGNISDQNYGGDDTKYPYTMYRFNDIAPGAPRNLRVTVDQDIKTNAYSFTWNPPSFYHGEVGDLKYCYAINTAPTALDDCTQTSAGQTSLPSSSYATNRGTNTMYLYTIDASNNINLTDPATVTFAYDGITPGIPLTILVNDISIKTTSTWQLSITWTAPTEKGAGIKEYDIYRSLSATSGFSKIGSTGGTSTGGAYSDTGLSQKTYYYYVRACDETGNGGGGCGAASSISSGFPTGKFTSAAGLTLDPALTTIKSKKATIEWNTDRTSSSSIEYGLKSNDYYKEEISNKSQVVNHSVTVTNLSPNTTYYFRALWTDEDGNTGQSSEYTFKTDQAPSVSNVTVSPIGVADAYIQFTTNKSASVNIYYGVNELTSLKQLNTASTTGSYTVHLSGLTDGSHYSYRIDTVDEDGFTYPGTNLFFDTPARPKISNLKIAEARNTAQTTIQVTWETNTATSSDVSYYPTDKPSIVRDQVDVNLVKGAHSMIIEGLISKHNYTLLLKSTDSIGNQAVSTNYTFTTSAHTRPPAITHVQIESSNNVKLSGINQNNISQLIVSWDTDSPSTSQIEYGEGIGSTYPQTTSEDNNLTLNHLIVINNLSPSKVYHLRIISTDSDGNIGRSGDEVTITAKVTNSTLDLITTSLREIFNL